MMSAFLASLEGGFVEETNVEARTLDTQDKTQGLSVGAKLSGLLSNILGAELKGDLGQKVSEVLESNQKSLVKFPSSSLFVRLREILIQYGYVKSVKSSNDVSSVEVGDIVEFFGDVSPNPATQIRKVFAQLLPLMEHHSKTTVTQLEVQMAMLRDAKPGKALKLGDQEITFTDKLQIDMTREALRMQQQKMNDDLALYQAMGSMLDGLFSSDTADTLIFKASGFNAVCRTYPQLARDGRIQDVFEANWFCLGKVIKVIPQGEEYNLLKGMPISYLAQSQFSDFARSLKTDDFSIEVSEHTVVGPAMIIATLAIFA